MKLNEILTIITQYKIDLNIPNICNSIELIIESQSKILDEQDEIASRKNDPQINSAYCTNQNELKSSNYHKLSIPIQALTILYGSSTSNNRSIDATTFAPMNDDLLILDIQGYELNVSTGVYRNEPLILHQQTLSGLVKLQHLNVENIAVRMKSGEDINNPRSSFTNRTTISNVNPKEKQLVDQETSPDTPEYKGNKSLAWVWEASKMAADTRNVSSMFSRCSNLQTLRLYRCQIDFLDDDTFDDLDQLTTLWIEGNSIERVPAFTFRGAPQLRKLVLRDNKIRYLFDQSLAGLVRLRHLDLSLNRLTTIPVDLLMTAPRMRKFIVLDNPLRSIHGDTFRASKNALVIIIGGTRVMMIVRPSAFRALNNLLKLAILNMRIDKLEKNFFDGLTSLQQLRISGDVNYIEFDTFSDIRTLKGLILRNSTLRGLSMDAFYGLSKLEKLDLSHNQLESLPARIFDQLDSLKELLLSHNNFAALPSLVLFNMGQVRGVIRLDGNPWNCTCEMAHDWLTLNLNKVKERRLLSQADRICEPIDQKPCLEKEWRDVYVRSNVAVPRCHQPLKYRGLTVVNVMTRKLKCNHLVGTKTGL